MGAQRPAAQKNLGAVYNIFLPSVSEQTITLVSEVLAGSTFSLPDRYTIPRVPFPARHDRSQTIATLVQIPKTVDKDCEFLHFNLQE